MNLVLHVKDSGRLSDGKLGGIKLNSKNRPEGYIAVSFRIFRLYVHFSKPTVSSYTKCMYYAPILSFRMYGNVFIFKKVTEDNARFATDNTKKTDTHTFRLITFGSRKVKKSDNKLVGRSSLTNIHAMQILRIIYVHLKLFTYSFSGCFFLFQMIYKMHFYDCFLTNFPEQ